MIGLSIETFWVFAKRYMDIFLNDRQMDTQIYRSIDRWMDRSVYSWVVNALYEKKTFLCDMNKMYFIGH